MKQTNLKYFILFYLLVHAFVVSAQPLTVDKIPSSAKAATYRTGEMDPVVTQVPQSVLKLMDLGYDDEDGSTANKIAEFLIKGAPNNYVKAKRIHDFITYHIKYGTAKDATGRAAPDPRMVLKYKQGDCWGCGHLFKAMADAAGIENKTIRGCVRNNISSHGGQPWGHFWNAVFIDNAWHIIDCTYDLRINTKTGERKKYKDFNLFISSGAKHVTNLADLEEETFIENPMSRDRFVKRAPYVNVEWWAYNLEIVSKHERNYIHKEYETSGSHTNLYDAIKSNGEPVVLKIKSPTNVAVSCNLYSSDVKQKYNEYAFSYRIGDTTFCMFSPPSTGTYKAYIRAKWNIGNNAKNKTVWTFRLISNSVGNPMPNSDNKLFSSYGFNETGFAIKATNINTKQATGSYFIECKYPADNLPLIVLYDKDRNRIKEGITGTKNGSTAQKFSFQVPQNTYRKLEIWSKIPGHKSRTKIYQTYFNSEIKINTLSINKADLVLINEEAQEIFIDQRDGKTYKTITIGNQIWMAENLNYDIDGSYCYYNKLENCKTYGRLYTWEQAKDLCPAGWHLPSDKEWSDIEMFLGGRKELGEALKSKGTIASTPEGLWSIAGTADGDDLYGFSALPAGFRWPHPGQSYHKNWSSLGLSTYWWTSTLTPKKLACFRMVGTSSTNMKRGADNTNDRSYSIRCVKD